MLKYQRIHPTMLKVLGGAGQQCQVLIADGSDPASSKIGPNAELQHLNLRPGVGCNGGASSVTMSVV